MYKWLIALLLTWSATVYSLESGPVASISPPSGVGVKGTVLIVVFGAEGDRVDTVDVFVDGRFLCNDTYMAICTWNTARELPGPHVISAVVKGVNGYTSYASSRVLVFSTLESLSVLKNRSSITIN